MQSATVILFVACFVAGTSAATCKVTTGGTCINGMCPTGLSCVEGNICCTAANTVTCADKVNPATGKSDCAAQAALCNNSQYYQLMTEQCPKTCGRCGTSSTCVDKVNPATGKSDCAANKALCTNSQYRTLMQDQCPKTCGFCT